MRAGMMIAVIFFWRFQNTGAMMLTFALLIMVTAILAAMWGLGGVPSGSMIIVQTLFYVFLALFAMTLTVGLARKPPNL